MQPRHGLKVRLGTGSGCSRDSSCWIHTEKHNLGKAQSVDMMQVKQGPGNSPDWNSVQDVQLAIGAVSTDQTRLAYQMWNWDPTWGLRDISAGTSQTELVHRICYVGYVWKRERMKTG